MGDWIESRNPWTGELVGRAEVTPLGEVRGEVERARVAQRAWAAVPVAERASRLEVLADLLYRRADELAELISAETGKVAAEAVTHDVTTVVSAARYFARRAPAVLAPEPIALRSMPHRRSVIERVPRGVVGIISPWNYPFAIPGSEVVMALVAGNGVVLKPSELTPLIALELKRCVDSAGIPGDLLRVVIGRGEVGAALVDAGIDYCMFTGSTATGRKVAAACGERLVPCALELGGKAPAIVCADAELERAARALVWGAFANQGQVCASVERVYAHRVVYDELVDRLVELTAQLRADPGAGGRFELDVGSMTWERQTAIVEEVIADAIARGAQLVCGGARSGRGLQFEPTILKGCRPDMEVMRREFFGPLLPIMAVDSDEAALAQANASRLGLLAYVFTADQEKGRRLASRIEAGTVMINDCLATYGAVETPWGGIKDSGIGRTHSEAGLRDLCLERHVNWARLSLRREPWWFPYSEKTARWLLRASNWILR